MALPMYCYDCAAPVPSRMPVCVICGNEPAIAPGTVLHGPREDYTIDAVLGKGGMGVAYQAIDPSGRKVVVKSLLVDPAPERKNFPTTQAYDAEAAVYRTTCDENLKRFKREAQIQSSIINPRFPAGYGYFFQDGVDFMAMEFIPGQDLDKVLKANPNGKLTKDDVLLIGVQVAEGIVAMHELTDSTGTPTPILHRDIKPGNIVQKPNGDVVILDFGISRPENQSAATQARMTTMGTAEYMAKEQLLGSPVKQSDLYSIAATLYQLVTGVTLPQQYAARPAEVKKLPAAWLPVFEPALDDEPRKRQADVREFHDALRSLLPNNLRNTVAPMVQTTTPSGRPQVQLNLGPLAHNLGWLIVSLLLATAVVAWIFAKPLIWKSALGVLVVIGLVKAGHEISKRVTANQINQIGRIIVWPFRMLWWLIRQPLRAIRWIINYLKGLKFPLTEWIDYLLFTACVILALISAGQNSTAWFSFSLIMGVFVLSLMSALKDPGFFNRLFTMLSVIAILTWYAFNYVH